MYTSLDGKVCVAGDGLLGSAFRRISSEEKCLVIASGVSNSRETRREPFERERALIEGLLEAFRDRHVLYFSTCSILGSTHSDYIQHKLEMEQLIARGATKFSVFRLPQVVGVVSNSTIISEFVRRLGAGSRIPIYARARRSLIDIRDVVRIVEVLLPKQEVANKVTNVSSAECVSVLDILSCVSNILGIDPMIDFLDGGDAQQIDISVMQRHLCPDDVVLSPGYWREVLRHYVPKIARFC